MRSITASCCALSASAAVLLLAGCAESGTPVNPLPLGAAAGRTRPTSVSYGVLYFFEGAPDGGEPYSDLIDVGGMLYGTTSIGGTHDSGTVFTITTSGNEAVLYSFGKAGSGDGAAPIAGLVKVDGTLYGTTRYGGAGTCYNSGARVQCGTVFAITKSGKETVLHRFGVASGDGAFPFGGLISVKGTLYGTTSTGGANGLGTVFAITTSGKETVRYSFKPAKKDGAYPYAGLVDVNGELYGTTLEGGAYGAGTVFRISTAGKERVLHSFGGPHDGAFPYDALVDVKGTFYGTTSAGGENRTTEAGVVFSITPSGAETVLHSFTGFSSSGDGANPVAGLIAVNGRLYGTTVSGGVTNFGTVFSITTSGEETVLYKFGGGFGSGGSGDGSMPYANLLYVKGRLYGTTFYGGRFRYGFCCGSVFRITP